jgi:hypothetical protein
MADRWIDAMTERMVAVLADHGYTEQQCRAIAHVMQRVPEVGPLDGLATRDRLQLDLLDMQGLDPASAVVIARAYQGLDLDRLMLSPPATADLLETNLVSLYRWRRSNVFPAAIEQGAASSTRTIAYWLADVLDEVARERYRDIGKGRRRFAE